MRSRDTCRLRVSAIAQPAVLQALSDSELDEILKGVSRSFYLSLVLLPGEVRPQLSVAYLVARAADTVADTSVIDRARRLALLERFGAALADPEACQAVAAEITQAISGKSKVPKENALVARLGLVLAQLHAFAPADHASTLKVLGTLIEGMRRDLQREEDAKGGVAQLQTMEELDTHTYFAAGCVGEYWTDIVYRNAKALKDKDRTDQDARGIRLGKGLQYVNVIRDTPTDLAAGRCYLPKDLLSNFGLAPADLRDPLKRTRALPALQYLQDIARSHFEAGWDYIEALPDDGVRLRVTTLLPLWIGLETLDALKAEPDPLDPKNPVKIPRQRVYRALAEAVATARITPLLKRLHARRV